MEKKDVFEVQNNKNQSLMQFVMSHFFNVNRAVPGLNLDVKDAEFQHIKSKGDEYRVLIQDLEPINTFTIFKASKKRSRI